MAKTQIKKTLNLTYPRLEPFRTVGDYIKSKAEVRKVQLPGYQWDRPRPEPEIDLSVARRCYRSTAEALESRRIFFKGERKVLDLQWDELMQLESSLRENYVKLDTFVKSNEEKRLRATSRRLDDMKLCEQRSRDIVTIKENIASLEQAKKDLDEEIRSHSLYEKYLNSAVGATTDFRNAEDLLDRYESLVKTRTELGIRQQDCFTDLESSKTKIAKMADENKFRLLGLNTVVAGLHSRYQIANYNAMQWEKVVWSIKSNALQIFKEISDVKLACWNMYTLMCKRKGETPKISEHDFESLLNYIKKTLRELEVVKAEAGAVTKKTFSSMEVQTSKVS